MGKKLINPYGTEWHESLKEQPCADCGATGGHNVVLSLYGFANPMVFCDHECLLQFAQQHFWEKEGRNKK